MPPIKEFPAFTKSIKFVVGNLIEILGHELEDVVKELPNVYYSSKIVRLKDWHILYQVINIQLNFSAMVYIHQN